MRRLEVLFHYLNITVQQIYFICISLSDGLERQSVRGKGIRRKYVETGLLDKVCVSDWAGVWGENDSGHNPHSKSVRSSRAARKSFVLQKLAMHSVCGPLLLWVPFLSSSLLYPTPPLSQFEQIPTVKFVMTLSASQFIFIIYYGTILSRILQNLVIL